MKKKILFGLIGVVAILTMSFGIFYFGDYTGTFNGTVGATTPSTGVFTTATVDELLFHDGSSASIFIGDDCGSWSITSAVANIGVGYESLGMISNGANGNVAVGNSNLESLTSGDYNTAVGYSSLRGGNTSNNIGLGFASGLYETGSGKLFIDAYERANESDGRTKSLMYGVMTSAGTSQYLYVNATLDADAFSLAGTTVTSTAAELNYVDGVTSAIQTQLDAKAPLASPTLTGQATIAGLKYSYQTISSGTLTLAATDAYLVLGANNANAKHVDLPAAPTTASAFQIINDGTVDLTLDGNGKTIRANSTNNSSITINAYECVSVIYTGRIWYVTEGHQI